jgi:hypothetical protein
MAAKRRRKRKGPKEKGTRQKAEKETKGPKDQKTTKQSRKPKVESRNQDQGLKD